MPSIAFCSLADVGNDWEKSFTSSNVFDPVKSKLNTFVNANNCVQRNQEFQKQVINNQFREPQYVESGLGITRNNNQNNSTVIMPYNATDNQRQQQFQQVQQQQMQHQQQQHTQYLNDYQDSVQKRKYKKDRQHKKKYGYPLSAYDQADSVYLGYSENDDDIYDSDADLDDDYFEEQELDRKTKAYLNKLYKMHQPKKDIHVPNYLGIDQGIKRIYTPLIEHFGPLTGGLGGMSNINTSDKELVILWIVFLIFLILFVGQLGELLRIIYHII